MKVRFYLNYSFDLFNTKYKKIIASAKYKSRLSLNSVRIIGIIYPATKYELIFIENYPGSMDISKPTP